MEPILPALVSYTQHNEIAVLGLNNPPVNGLTAALRQTVIQLMESAIGNPEIKAIVIHGDGRNFSAGADIAEFGKALAVTNPDPTKMNEVIEGSSKPVIAAIHGVAFGGGTELALSCHYRLATADAQIGLPEVTLGIVPGAGGTQRLPRLIGIAAALDMIVSGKPVKAPRALELGLIDQMIDGGVMVESALVFAREIIAKGATIRRTGEIVINAENADTLFAAAREKVQKTARGQPAPLKCIECVEAALRLPFSQGLKFEREQFELLEKTVESNALRHAFFAERAAAKVPNIPSDTVTRSIKQAAVIGAGTMGGGIAMNFANAGIPVIVLEMKQDALDRGLAVVRNNYEASAKKGRLKPEEAERRIGLIQGSLDYKDLADADIIIEAVFEDMSVKQQVFAALDSVAKPGAILASNTSTLDLNQIAGFTKRPTDVIGTHFFSPANVMRLLEVVRGEKTADDVLVTTLQLAKKIGKVGVVAGVCDGFIGNRMLEEYLRQAYFLLDEGALPQQIDRALQNWGMAMGPLAMMDMAGQDIGYKIRQRRAIDQPDRPYSKIPDRVAELGRYGQKTGAGFYRYEPGNRTPLPDAEIDQMIIAYSAEIGIERRAISDEEICSRCILALVNEGARILEEGIALRASDIDMVYLSGYGFPALRGGPMFYADTLGLPEVVAKMESYAKNPHGLPSFWKPAPILANLASAHKTFN